MNVEIVTDPASLYALSEDWQRLWKLQHEPDVFSSLAWVRASLQTYGTRRKLVAPVVYDDDEVVAILPLVIEDQVLKFAGSPRSDYNDVLADPARAGDVIPHAFEALRNLPETWTHGQLENIPESSPLRSAEKQIRSAIGGYVKFSLSTMCPRVCFDSPEVVADILRKKSLKRHTNKLRRMGELRFRHLHEREEIRNHLPAFFDQHIARRALAGEQSLFCDAASRQFYEHLVDELDPQESLRFAVVDLDGQPVAYHFGFENNGRFIWYKPAFDIDMHDYSPGEVLLKHLFEYAAEESLSTFDFTVGTESFKLRFANAHTRNYTMYVCRPGLRGTAAALRIRAKERLKQNQRLFDRVKSIIDFGTRSRASLSEKLRRHGLWGCLKKSADQLYRKCLFRRDELLVFESEQPADAAATPNGDIEIRSGKLSELAELCVQYPHEFTGEKLSKAVRRLKEGDQLHLAWSGGRCVHVAWTGQREEFSTESDVGPGCAIPLEHPARVIYDCWTPPDARGQGIYPYVLGALSKTEPGGGMAVWVSCRADNRPSHIGIEKAGFRCRYRAVRKRYAGIWESKSLTPAE